MAMTPQLWTISGLAVELRMDRRTVASKLRAVPADGQVGIQDCTERSETESTAMATAKH